MNRSAYNEFEDVRMLKWLARKEDKEAPLGITLWNQYVKQFGDQHPAQSLNGRMRRQIIPNLMHYVKWLRNRDLRSLYRSFKERLTDETRKALKHFIASREASRTEEGGDSQVLMSEDDDDDDDEVSVEAPPSVPHKDRRKNGNSFRNREEPPDDMDEPVPPLSLYRRKTIGNSREDSEGPSTSRGPVSPTKRPRPADDVRRKRDIEDDEDSEFNIPPKRKVIGEVSSTANLHSDDEEEAEDLRRSLKKKGLKKREEFDKSPESALDINIHNVVGVVSSTASIRHHQEEPTSSGRLVIRSPDMFTSNKKNTLVTSDDDIFFSPKQSPKTAPRKSVPRRRDLSEELEKSEDNERYRSPKQVPPKKKVEEKRRTEYEEEDDFSPVRPKKTVVPAEISDEEDAEVYVAPKVSKQPKKKLARTLDDYYRPAPTKKQPSEDEFDVYERSLTKKAKKVNGSVSPKKAGPSATVPTLLSPRREEEVDDFDVFESSPVKKKGHTKKDSLPAPALMSPRRDYEEDEEFAMFSSSKNKKVNGKMSPKKAAPSTSVVLESRIEDDYDFDDDFAMFQSSSSKKKKTCGVVPKKTTPPRAVSPQKPTEEEEEEDDSDYVSPKSTPRKQKISVNSEDDEIVVKPTEQAAELSEPDDDDYVSPASSPIPKIFSGISDEDEVDTKLPSSSNKIEKELPAPESSSRRKSPVKSPQKPITSTRPSQRYQVDKEDEEVEKIMMSSQKTSSQKTPQKKFQKEVEVQKTPQKAVFSPRRRTSDEKEDEEDESEVDKTMRLFESPAKKTTTPKKLPVSTQKPVQPADDEDDDLADRIMATIRERKSLPTAETRVEPEQELFEERMEDAVETDKEEEKEDELPQTPVRKQVSAGGRRLSAGLDMIRSTIDDDLMTSGPLVREDLVSPTRGIDTPGQMNSLQRKRPSYVGLPAPKDDRPDYHWIVDRRGFKRWMRKPAWLLTLEAEEVREEGGMMSPMMSPAHDPEPATEDEEPVGNGEEGKLQKKQRKRTNRRRRTVWNNFGRKKKHSVKVVDTDDEEMPADLPEEVMTEDEEPVHVAEVDTEEEEEEEAHSSTAQPRRHRVQQLTAEELEGEYFFQIDKLGRRRKYPRKNRDLPRPDVLANMIREGVVHAGTLEQRDKVLGTDETARRPQASSGEPVKKRRGRPPKKKFIEVEQSPEMDDDPMPGTSSIIRVPPFEVQTSLRSTCPEGEDDERTFSFQQWNLDMRPVAEQAARTMYTEMFQHLEGRLIPESELRDIVQGDNVQQLFDKMFKEDEQQGEEDFVIVGVESFSAKKLRLKYFVKVQEELKKHTHTPHVRSAVLTFFQYFEYTVAATVTGKNFDTYIFLMDRLIDVAIPLATF